MRMYAANTNPPKQHLIAVTSRGCRFYFESMLAKFRESELISRYASGMEEEYTEIDSLLTDITQLLDDHDAQKKEGKLSAKSWEDLLHEQGRAIRMATLKPEQRKQKESGNDTSMSSSNEDTFVAILVKKKKRGATQDELNTQVAMQMAIANYFNAKAEKMQSKIKKE
jgi:hypothetical protein